MQRLDLNGTWQLCHFDGYGETYDHRGVAETLRNREWLAAQVPGSVYHDLAAAGWIGDVTRACNSLAAQWVETQYWYYRRTFDAPAASGRHFLVLDGLDLDALVFVNGALVGEHHNAFRPCRLDITAQLKPTDNELLIRIDAGLIRQSDRTHAAFNTELTAMLTRRGLLRKPQFGARWDWAPRLMNVGIAGGVWLETCDVAYVENFALTTELARDHQAATLHVRAHVVNVTDAPLELELTARVVNPEIVQTVRQTVAPGAAVLTATLPITQPELWWPRGQGSQHLYDVDTTVRHLAGPANGNLPAHRLEAGATVDERAGVVGQCRRQVGVRSVRIDEPAAADGGRYFHLLVNDRPIFCQGACWVPPHLLPAQTTPADYDELVSRAVECGMNTLRVWGGGWYAPQALLDACDRAGLLVWHDFMFACTKVPGDAAFVQEVRAEARHVVREHTHHASLAVWCGNNELELGVTDGWIASTNPDERPERPLFFEHLAQVVATEDPGRPYRPTTPWSGTGLHPNDPHVGTQHPWLVGLGPPKGDYWCYRADESRFCIEGGMLGPSTLPTLHEILPEGERHVGSRTWLHHDNSQNTWRGESMLDNLLRIHLHPQPRTLAFEDYVHYAGILHGEALETAIDNWRRRKFDSAAAVFWMFNDVWPATTSWTPIDYARRRKTAFWYVKRAFADVRVIVVELPGEAAVYVVNERPTPVNGTVRYGVFAIAGGLPLDEQTAFTCPANAAQIVARLPLDRWDRLGIPSHGAFAILQTSDGAMSQHRLFRARFRRLQWTPAKIEVQRAADDTLVLRSAMFAWAVCLDATGEQPLADNYCDLLPGIARRVAWPAERPTPTPRAANPAF